MLSKLYCFGSVYVKQTFLFSFFFFFLLCCGTFTVASLVMVLYVMHSQQANDESAPCCSTLHGSLSGC